MLLYVLYSGPLGTRTQCVERDVGARKSALRRIDELSRPHESAGLFCCLDFSKK